MAGMVEMVKPVRVWNPDRFRPQENIDNSWNLVTTSKFQIDVANLRVVKIIYTGLLQACERQK
jgi:hypothetical protein